MNETTNIIQMIPKLDFQKLKQYILDANGKYPTAQTLI